MEFPPPSIFSFWGPMLLCLPLSLLTLTKFFLPLVYLHVSDTKCGATALWPRVVFSSSHWNWVFATYQVLKKLRTANREDRHRELFIYRGRHNPCVMDCSPCNEHLLPLARNVNNGTSEYKEQCKPLKTRANPLRLYVFTCWEVYSAR